MRVWSPLLRVILTMFIVFLIIFHTQFLKGFAFILSHCGDGVNMMYFRSILISSLIRNRIYRLSPATYYSGVRLLMLVLMSHLTRSTTDHLRSFFSLKVLPFFISKVFIQQYHGVNVLMDVAAMIIYQQMTSMKNHARKMPK